MGKSPTGTTRARRVVSNQGQRANIYERIGRNGDVVWRVMWREQGKQPQESFMDYESAEEFRRLVENVGGTAARKVLAARRGADDDMPTLRQWTHRYLDPTSGLLTGVEPGTRADYLKQAENSFLVVLGDFPVDAIQRADVGRFVAWLEDQPSPRRPGEKYAAKTVANRHGLLSSVLSAAVQEKLREDNPAHKTRLTKGMRREPVFLSPDEFSTLLHFIPDYYQRFVLFLAGTGCRWGEATAVPWSALNLRAAPPTVRISQAWKKGPTAAPVLKQPKSRAGRRTISLSADVVQSLGTPGAADELVFKGKQSGGHLWPSGFRQNVWEPAVRKAMDTALCEAEGLVPLTRHPSVHDLRHTHASWLIAAGVPLPYIQVRLGHESINTTVGVYGHLVPDAHATMADVIGGTLAGVRPLRVVPDALAIDAAADDDDEWVVEDDDEVA